MAGGQGLRTGCAAAIAALVITVLVAVGIITFTSVYVLHRIATRPSSAPSTTSPGDGGGFGPDFSITITQPKVTADFAPKKPTGFDVSFPQCGKVLPSTDGGFAVVGMNGGKPLTRNKCRDAQWHWAGNQAAREAYVNTSDPATESAASWGQKIGQSAVYGLRSTGVPTGTRVWLDVETGNVWNGSWDRHVTVLQTMAQAIADAGYPVGFYSTVNLWYEITGDAKVNVPIWLAPGVGSQQAAMAACGRVAFGGQTPRIVQWVQKSEKGFLLDHNALCPTPNS